MTDATTTPAAPIPDLSAGVAPVRFVTGTRRAQALVNGQWWDLDGISSADLLTTDRRYAARLTFNKVSTVSITQAGAAPAGIDGSAVKMIGVHSSAPVRTVSMPADGALTTAVPTSIHEGLNPAVAAIGAVVRVVKADQAAKVAGAAQAAA